ncbi:unnamed protein product, partial [Owenia fusiformis]
MDGVLCVEIMPCLEGYKIITDGNVKESVKWTINIDRELSLITKLDFEALEKCTACIGGNSSDMCNLNGRQRAKLGRIIGVMLLELMSDTNRYQLTTTCDTELVKDLINQDREFKDRHVFDFKIWDGTCTNVSFSGDEINEATALFAPKCGTVGGYLKFTSSTADVRWFFITCYHLFPMCEVNDPIYLLDQDNKNWCVGHLALQISPYDPIDVLNNEESETYDLALVELNPTFAGKIEEGNCKKCMLSTTLER